MTKELRKAIMNRSSSSSNIFSKSCTTKTCDSYIKQSHFCVNLLREIKQKYFENNIVKNINDNKKFWKTINPFFTNKDLNTTLLI